MLELGEAEQDQHTLPNHGLIAERTKTIEKRLREPVALLGGETYEEEADLGLPTAPVPSVDHGGHHETVGQPAAAASLDLVPHQVCERGVGRPATTSR